MKRVSLGVTCAALPIVLAACALGPGSLQAGQAESDVIARFGPPTQRYREGPDRLLEYRQGPAGQNTYMVRIGPDGKLISYEQVLTLEKFSTIKVNQATRDDVLKTVGTPSEVRFFPLIRLEAWSYPFKEAGVWDSMMSIYVDGAGIVRKLENGPDMRRMDRDNDR